MKNTRKRKRSTGPVRLSKERLDELIAEAIVDCYNESEEVTGLYTMIEDNLAFPFATTVLGVPVTVERVPTDATGRDRRRVPSCRHPPDRSTPRSSIAVTATGRQRVDRRLPPLAARRLAGDLQARHPARATRYASFRRAS